MKKILSLIVLLVALTSCEEDVKFNDPAVQAFKDNELWKATAYTAVMNGDGSFSLTATNGFETVTLRTQSADPLECEGVEVPDEDSDKSGCQYLLGYNVLNSAAYILSADGIEMAYQTGTTAEPDDEEGRITIYDDPKYTNLSKGFISGSFDFKATDNGGNSVYFDRGVFYKIPITAN